MDLLPLFHNLRGRRCLVVGGGDVALRKLRQLADAGASIEVVAPQVNQAIREMAKNQTLNFLERPFAEDDIAGAVLVVAATNDDTVNAQVSQLAQAANIPVNVVDSPGLCTVVFPSIVDRSPVQIAISSGGNAPVLARMLRTRLEALIPSGYGKLAALAGKYRDRVKTRFHSGLDRKAFWENVFEGDIAELVYSERLKEADQRLEQRLEQDQPSSVGEVYLVGGGPGDPDLLTFRALRLMQKADIVLYDRLVSKEVMALVRRDAELIYVGKTAGDHPVTQENINEKLAEYALQGKRVLRLKGGDPFIFGRGGEEIAHLAERGVPFQVVPGITAASGCASYAGIPLTHRDYAQSVRFITGHLKDHSLDLNWQDLVSANQTLVFYMGLSGLESICKELIARGKSATTPAALVEKGTTARQRVFIGNLTTLPDIVRKAEAKAPTLIIVGDVVKLHDQLSWFKG
ncbi:siroheme synthase CysG [Porticoccus litoralis]|uniref:Siroheme synthase n=1 Tax=Porticoccus litoralis TaxID=434086 RepID=A0AAW8B673_9GAMM|nr:siroheme synthase CysG [Porticoccus litoralis]MDP1521302.1 siroheme synthase CysG [Porticoccus litoralis]